jgi:hypothetical protein
VSDDECPLSVDDKYPLSKGLGSPWARLSLLRHQLTSVGDNCFGCPREYLQAVKRYTDDKFVFRSEIWGLLQKWREYAKSNPESTPWFEMIAPHPLCDDRAFVAYFKQLILAVVFYGEKEIVQALLDVLTQPPDDPDMHSVRAVIAAFRDLFKGGSEDDWPLKKQVRERAIEILKQARSPIPKTSSEWARIFRKAGLSTLRNAKRRSTRARIG